MDWNLSIMLMIVVFGFIASFVDSVVGGGGLISTPALLAAVSYTHLRAHET